MSDEVKEIAKAAAEGAKFGTKALDVTERMFGFLGRVLGEPADHVSGIISDRLKFYRWERQLRLADKAEEILKSRGVSDAKAVPPKLALPILEAASLEDSDELQDLWARLLANAMDPKFEGEISMMLVQILKSLNPLDVQLLEMFYGILKQDNSIDWSKIQDYSLKKEQIMDGLGVDQEKYYIAVYNLFRNQCLVPAIIRGGISIGSEPVTAYKGAEQVSMTQLGVLLVKSSIQK